MRLNFDSVIYLGWGEWLIHFNDGSQCIYSMQPKDLGAGITEHKGVRRS